jgi:hypothetical protein
MKESEMRAKVDRVLRRRSAILAPSALTVGLALATGCQAHTPVSADPNVGSQIEAEEPVGDLGGNSVGIYEAPVPRSDGADQPPSEE